MTTNPEGGARMLNPMDQVLEDVRVELGISEADMVLIGLDVNNRYLNSTGSAGRPSDAARSIVRAVVRRTRPRPRGGPVNLTPIFRQADPDDEVVPCILDDCEALCPLAGPDGIVRHLLAVHPESFVARAIFRRLVEVQLTNAEEAGR